MESGGTKTRRTPPGRVKRASPSDPRTGVPGLAQSARAWLQAIRSPANCTRPITSLHAPQANRKPPGTAQRTHQAFVIY